MTRKTMLVLGVCGLTMAAVMARVSAGQEVTAAPGQMTRARVWVENRSRAEAIPISVQNVAPDAPPLRVQVLEVPPTVRNASVVARVARQRWEYRSLIVAAGTDPGTVMAGLGTESWEAVGMTTAPDGSIVVLFKRPQ